MARRTSRKTEGTPGKDRSPSRDRSAIRRCAVCRETAPAGDLLRFVASPDGHPVVDRKRKMAGRGCSMCWRRECLRGAPAALSRALDGLSVEVSAEGVQELVRASLRHSLLDELGLARRVGQLKSGADSTERQARSGWAQALALSSDAGEATRRRFEGVAERCGLPLFELPLDAGEVGRSLGCSERSVLAIGRGRLALRLLTSLQRVRSSL
jgi:predicted RNA-binding protein YlxR (DUF448 family)